MGVEKYIVNKAWDLIAVDANTIAIISTKGRFFIKGASIATAILNILQHFEVPVFFDDVIQNLSDKYRAASLTRMLDMLVEKNILISETDFNTYRKHSNAFLEKSFFYTLGGKPFQEIVDELSSLNVGIIGTNQLVTALLDELIRSELLTHFNLKVTDSEVNQKIGRDQITIVSYASASEVIAESDVIIAASNYTNYSFFNQINEWCFEKNKKWIRVEVNGLHAEVGPLFMPNETCCYACLQMRRRQNMTPEEYVFDDFYLKQHFTENGDGIALKVSSLYPLNSLATSIACAELMKDLVNLKCNLLNQVISVNGLDFKVQTDYIYKDYACSVCAQKDVVRR